MAQTNPESARPALPVLQLSGSPEAMGRRHGERFAHAIRHFAAERLTLAGEPAWAGRSLPREAVLRCAENCLAYHRRYAPDLTAELDAMAQASGLSSAQMLIVSGFTDFVDTVYSAGAPAPAEADNCTAFLVPGARAEDAPGLFGQTWDMHESAAEHAILIDGRPRGGLPFLAFTSVGCLGMIGMNAAGITVGINNLSAADGRPGVTWNFVVRKVLQQERFEDALACITEAPRAGAHNYLLMDAHGAGANVEATATHCVVTRLADQPLAHTNHCLAPQNRALERERLPQSQASSEARLQRARALLSAPPAFTTADLAAITRDTEAICYRGAPPNHVATCGAVIADPGRRELWALRGLPTEQHYQRFSLA